MRNPNRYCSGWGSRSQSSEGTRIGSQVYLGLTRECGVHIHCIDSGVNNDLLDLFSAMAWVQVFLAVPDLPLAKLGEQCTVAENVETQGQVSLIRYQ